MIEQYKWINGWTIKSNLNMLIDILATTGETVVVRTSFSYSQWGDLLTSYNGITITYDEIGNPLTYYNGSACTFAWTGRRITSAVNDSSNMYFAIHVGIMKL